MKKKTIETTIGDPKKVTPSDSTIENNQLIVLSNSTEFTPHSDHMIVPCEGKVLVEGTIKNFPSMAILSGGSHTKELEGLIIEDLTIIGTGDKRFAIGDKVIVETSIYNTDMKMDAMYNPNSFLSIKAVIEDISNESGRKYAEYIKLNPTTTIKEIWLIPVHMVMSKLDMTKADKYNSHRVAKNVKKVDNKETLIH